MINIKYSVGQNPTCISVCVLLPQIFYSNRLLAELSQKNRCSDKNECDW